MTKHLAVWIDHTEAPSRTKHTLFKFLHKHEPALEARIVGIETVNHSSDVVFLRYAQDYFKLTDPMRGAATRETSTEKARIMNNPERTAYLIRNEVMNSLSDAEAASVSNAEAAASLAEGAEYLDLQRLDQGVQRAQDAMNMGVVLPRSAVHEATWTKILEVVAQASCAASAP